MHSAIFVVNQTDKRADWLEFLAKAQEKVKEGKHARRPGESAWLLDFQANPASLAWLIVLCDQRGMLYEILPLADAPQWLQGGPDPKPTAVQNEDSWKSVESEF